MGKKNKQELAHPFQHGDEYPADTDNNKYKVLPFRRNNQTKIETSKSAATVDVPKNQTKSLLFNSGSTISSITSSTARNRVNISFALAEFEMCGILLLAKNTARIPQVLLFFATSGSSNAEQSSTGSKVTDERTHLLKNGNIHEFERNYQGGGTSDVSSIRRVNAFKSSQLLCSGNGLENTAQYFPDTNLVVTVRHPVLHFQSQYNFFYRHVENDGDLPKSSLFQGCLSSHFHHWPSRLSLTASDSRKESDLLDQNNLLYHPRNWKGKMLIMQYEQLVDANSTRRNAMERVYENFIGVPSLSFDSTLSSSNMGTRRKLIDNDNNSKLIDICHTKHTVFRYRVIKEAEMAASWIKYYLLDSDKVVVPDKYHFLLHILDGWSVNPCIQTMDYLMATSRYRVHVESSANISINPEKISMNDERSIRNETDLIDFTIAGFVEKREKITEFVGDTSTKTIGTNTAKMTYAKAVQMQNTSVIKTTQ